jgi:glucose/arabinose dehydrogenase
MQRSIFAFGPLVFTAFTALPIIVVACTSGSTTNGTIGDPDAANVDGPTPTPVDAAPPPIAEGEPCRGIPLPTAEHYVAPGLCARVVAANVGRVRQLTFAPNGDLFSVTSGGEILRFVDADGDGFFQAKEITKYGSTTGNGNNADIDVTNGYLYAGSPNGVKRWPYSPTATSGGTPEDVVTGQPGDGHSKHTVRVYDGYLYVHSGSAGNASDPKNGEYDDQRSLIRRFALASFKPGTPFAWLSGEVVTTGLRNANGFVRNAAGRIFAVVNGLDNVTYKGVDVHNDNPGEQVVEIAAGRRYGYPFCYTAQRVVVAGQVIAPGTQLPWLQRDEAWCTANSSPPATFVQAHSAPLDIAFFDAHPQGGLPEKYRGGAFVAMHGSWNRSPATGYKVVWIPFDAAGNAPMPTSTATETKFPYETILGGGNASGPKEGAWSWADQAYADDPRFAGVAVSPIDGALYATSDSSGYVYRVGRATKP